MMKVLKKLSYEPDYAVAPGETLKETIESLNMTQKELATRTGLTEQTIIRIFKGEQPITYETANKLELVTGVPARFWNNLESNYREQLAKIEEKAKLEKEIKWLDTIEYKELVKRKIIENSKDKYLILKQVFTFFGVSSVDAWKNIWKKPEVAAKRSHAFETNQGSASIWIRIGEIEANKINCEPFNREKFKDALIKIRRLTTENIETSIPKMQKLCSASGVALVLVPEMKKVPWSGASKWLNSEIALIILNLRGKSEDKFWFSFFHEAGHILNDNKGRLYIADNSNDPEELKANQFAADFLIPAKYNKLIAALNSKKQITDLAHELGISPGIVAGRFHYLTGNYRQFNDLINTFKWKNL
jgi:addiction module HigA family antidote